MTATTTDDTVNAAQAYVPAPALRGLVTGGAYEMRGFAPGAHRGLPSCAITFVIPLEARLDLVVGPDGAARSMTSCVGGLHAAPVVIGHDGTQVGFHLAISPAGARALFDRPAAELAATVVEVEELWGADGRELLDRLSAAASWADRCGVLDDVLARRLARHAGGRRAPAAEVTEAWRQLTAGHSTTITVAGVARHVGWSRRHLSSRFAAEFGVAPKTAGRIARFESAADRLKRGGERSLATVAAEGGFADQAHMAREWRDLAGCAPSVWLREEVLPFVQDADAAPA